MLALRVLLVLLLCACPVLGQGSDVNEIFRPDSTIAVYRTVTTDDSSNLTGLPNTMSIAAVSTISAANLPNLEASLRFSDAGASCDIVIVRGAIVAGVWKTQGYEVVTGVTASASDFVDEDVTRYLAPDQLLSPGGSPFVKLVVHNLSAGSVRIYVRKH